MSGWVNQAAHCYKQDWHWQMELPIHMWNRRAKDDKQAPPRSYCLHSAMVRGLTIRTQQQKCVQTSLLKVGFEKILR
jgi:hypothetical protein